MTPGKPYGATERLANQQPSSDLKNLEVRRNVYTDAGKDVTAQAKTEGNGALEENLKQDSKQYFCYSCGKDCTRVRYHHSKNPPHSATSSKASKEQRYDLCPLCFRESRFPSNTKDEDYVKIENERYRGISDKEAPWSDAELLLLLEGLEMFDENWESVADHVGSRTREECVLKFLQLEIEDKYLDGEAPTTNGDLSYLSGGRLPFSQADNPVMSVMGFLAGLADPATTAAAAGRSVEEMRKQLKGRIEKEATPGATESVKGETDNNMDVDDMTSLAIREPPTSSDLPTLALSLTAARSAALSSHTERQLTNQVSAAVNLQLQKLELKLTQFSEMEALLQAERREVERMRQKLFLDRLAFRKRVKEVEAKMGGMKIATGPAEKLSMEHGDGVQEAEMVAEGGAGFQRHEI